MSDLTDFRDHCRRMATITGGGMALEPSYTRTLRREIWTTPNPTDAERELWTKLADEIDSYLSGRRRAGRGDVLMPHCPTPWKQSHPGPGSADAQLASLRRNRRAFAAFQHIYQCPCGAYHVGDRRKKPRRSKPKGAW